MFYSSDITNIEVVNLIKKGGDIGYGVCVHFSVIADDLDALSLAFGVRVSEMFLDQQFVILFGTPDAVLDSNLRLLVRKGCDLFVSCNIFDACVDIVQKRRVAYVANKLQSVQRPNLYHLHQRFPMSKRIVHLGTRSGIKI